MSDDLERVGDTKEGLVAELSDDSSIAKFIEIPSLDDYYRWRFIDPVFEVKPEDLKEESADENDDGDSDFYVKLEPADEYEVEALCFSLHVRLCALGTYRMTTHPENLEKSGNSKVLRESQGKWKKSGEVKSCVFFQVLNTPKLVFRPGLCPRPRWGSLQHSPRSPSRLGRGTPHLLPQLLQPQLLNN